MAHVNSAAANGQKLIEGGNFAGSSDASQWFTKVPAISAG